jgi:hypothetical protein
MASVVAEFICGCRHEVSIEEIGWWREISTDRDGFVVCVSHRVRRKNWKSLPNAAGRADWTLAHVRPLDYERYLLFGEKLPVHQINFDNSTPDRRDNRDPETIGLELLSHGNGRSKES